MHDILTRGNVSGVPARRYPAGLKTRRRRISANNDVSTLVRRIGVESRGIYPLKI